MPSQILPIANRSSYSSLGAAPSAMPSATSSAPATTMLIKPADDDPTASLLVSSRFEDESVVHIKPLLSRASSFSSTTSNSMGNNTNFYQKRRRRTASENSLSSFSSSSSRRSSFGQGVSHVASETFLVTRLGLKLLRYLGYNFPVFLPSFLYGPGIHTWKRKS